MVAVADSLFEDFPETISPDLARLVDNVIAVCFEREPTRFLKAHLVPMDGAEQSLVCWEFDALAFGVAFDAEFGTALRAMGLEYPGRINGGVHGAPSSVEA
jgi:hypothetical protein